MLRNWYVYDISEEKGPKFIKGVHFYSEVTGTTTIFLFGLLSNQFQSVFIIYSIIVVCSDEKPNICDL